MLEVIIYGSSFEIYFISLLLILIAILLWQVKRCAEMSRKLRFFKDQINKAGLMSSPHPVLQPDIELEELEVLFI